MAYVNAHFSPFWRHEMGLDIMCEVGHFKPHFKTVVPKLHGW